MTARRARLAVLLGALGAALAVAVVVAGGAPGAALPRCAAGGLSAVYVDTTGAAGSRDGEYGFRNRSRGRCGLSGYPAVMLLAASGRVLPTTYLRAPGAYGITAGPVTLAPGAVAYFGIHYAAQTGFGNLTCPTSAALRLTAPGTTAGHVLRGAGGRIQPFGGSITHLHCGVVHVSALTARRFQ